MPDLFSDLNPIQKQAVLNTEGPTLILAGAGSGKTKVLTHRVAYLITEKQIPAENILMITFTNKAAEEMKNRIYKLLHTEQPFDSFDKTQDKSAQGKPTPNSLPIMGTFHSFCARILRKEGKVLGYPVNFNIYDENDALDAVKESLKSLDLSSQKISPTSIRSTISGAKNEMISSLEYVNYAQGYFQETVAKVYLKYQEILEKNKAMDFDDLLLLTVKLFQNYPEILSKYQIQFRYILIDEYQDTNAVQYLLSKLLSNRYKNICVVGDASQSIYAFRGADFRNIVNFQKDYPNTKIFNLEQNYRSTQNILDTANAVISKNRSHPILKLWTANSGGDKIHITEVKNETAESLFVAETIQKSGLPFISFAVLYRTNAQSRALEEVFLKLGLPYVLVGGTRFYERKEIKDMLSYLRLFANPEDTISRARIEKIGKGRMVKFMVFCNEVIAILSDPAIAGESKEKQSQEDKIATSGRKIDPPRNDNYGYSTLELLDKTIDITEYFDYLEDGTEVGKTRIENVQELKSVAEEFPNLTDFLQQVTLVENEYSADEKLKRKLGTQGNREAITLTTLHQAKGLEWPVVFMVGMEEGLFPHSRCLLDPNEMEEERRLCYVGITRAKEQLYLTYTRQRLYFGTKSANLVSRFIMDIPENLSDTKAPSALYQVEDGERSSRTNEFMDDVTLENQPKDGRPLDEDTDDWLNS
ncbi:MAG: UvrD-helicase domain-containing protein [Candidatus Daviesbacteria bacterium]|nr:UvrD-helicase domain-containing protein [Candidatus Daviesbacteria bacterium]